MTKSTEDALDGAEFPARRIPPRRNHPSLLPPVATQSIRPAVSISSPPKRIADGDAGLRNRRSASSTKSVRSVNSTSTATYDNRQTLGPLRRAKVSLSHKDKAQDIAQLPAADTVFTKTIEGIEGLLNEALEIAREAADGSTKPLEAQEHAQVDAPAEETGGGRTNTTTKKPTSTRAPILVHHDSATEGQGSKHLHRNGSIKPCGVVQHEGSKTKSSVAGPQTSFVSHQDFVQPLTRRRSTQLNATGELGRHLRAPDAASVSLKEPLEHTLRRKSSKSDLPRHSKEGERPISSTVPARSSYTGRAPHSLGEQSSPLDMEQETVVRYSKDIQPLHKEPSRASEANTNVRFNQVFGLESSDPSSPNCSKKNLRHIDLSGCRHVDIKGVHMFDVHSTCSHQPVARDWAVSRKRFAAAIACLNTALIGIIIGIYAGQVPAIQYVVVDLSQHMILGNVALYLGLAIPTLFFWPLPLMHGRKPYTVISLAIALCLQIPQGIAVSDYRSPDSNYRTMLLLSRAISGFALGFLNINLQATLLDLFGASLQSRNTHQEGVDPYDVRRHGGGMGLWLGFWCWCYVGSISLGFFLGTLTVDGADVSWGFWASLMLMMLVLLLNVIGPEPRRSAYRRTVAEVMGEGGHVRRISKGEIKMHLTLTGPYWWGEEVKAGAKLCWMMFLQPGFALLAIYSGWAYAHFTLILMLLGALASKYYRLRPLHVGVCVLALGLGAMLATPFQKASFFSRARRHRQRTDSMTLQKSLGWSSHLIRRAIYTMMLPVAGLAYALASKGPSISIAVPSVFAGIVGFLSNLAIAECQGIMMETFDTSDLQPGMTGRPTRRTTSREQEQRTNFSCYPRISAGIAVSQSLSFCFAAIATGVCGRVERRLGAKQATEVVAGVLMGLTLLLTVALLRFRVVRMIPIMEDVTGSRTAWEPIILGRPSGTTRKISVLEAGRLTRWTEIRRRNRLTS